MGKHILLYTDDSGPGSVGRYTHTLALALVGRGYRVTYAQSYADDPAVAQRRERGITHRWISYDAATDAARSITDHVDAGRILGDVRPDIVYFSDSCPISNVAARQVALQRHIPFAEIVHRVTPALAERFSMCLPVLAGQYQAAARVVLLSEHSRRLLVSHFNAPASKTVVIHQGRPPESFTEPSLENRARVRSEFAAAPEEVICLIADQPDPSKGLALLVGTAARLANSPAGARLRYVCMGDGGAGDAAARLLASSGLAGRIHRLGQRPDLPALLDAADIYVQPADAEDTASWGVDAMARGLPVVASSGGVTAEELGGTGATIPHPSESASAAETQLANVLEKWTLDPVLRRQAGQDCRRRAQAVFREEQMLERTLGLLEAVSAQPAARVVTPRPSLTRLVGTALGETSDEATLDHLMDRGLTKLSAALPTPPPAAEYATRTPVCMLVFNRPRQTARVFAAVRRARPPKLLLVADGPRDHRPADATLCAEVREIVTRVDWPCEVLTDFAPQNLGCTRRVVSGLDWVFEQVAECIILEDDCLPSPDFFRFCDEMLERYRHDAAVRCVSGNSFQFGLHEGPASYYRTPHILIWGWATWRRAWRDNDVRMAAWPDLQSRAFTNGVLSDATARAYWNNVFSHARAGRTAWDCPWLFSCWAHGGHGLSPVVDLVENIGFDQQATGDINRLHPIFLKIFGNIPVAPLPATLLHPPAAHIDRDAALRTQRFHYEQNWGLLRRELVSRLLVQSPARFQAMVARLGGPAGLATLLHSGLSRLPVLKEDEPLVARCAAAVAKADPAPPHLAASLLLGGA